ncbi:histidinol-phosphate transaminase [Corynebacterium aquatimens]|uniref:histidinol-phosphate transaminase n=1 Tax=Corynebacterium TaxID=1716 RepID=UPI001F032C5D|nr:MULTISPECIES: histidinol-phosphate transaminase [Corynebacterium]QYH20012.1 histidinol-phosphate transaminase [Corynebacterium aquatimens]UIZ92795.1 histidinol-phosphate transaminase [Corynebacterium sp. CNCTC7651]
MFRPDLDQLPAYVPGARNEQAVKLSSNECAEAPLPTVTQAMVDALADVNRYPDMGVAELRTALAEHLGVSFDQVAVGTGSSALCQQLVTAAAGPGDEVVFPWRSFEAYPIFARIAGATPVPVPLGSDHGLDLPAMAAAITEQTRLVFVCNPNNPTGTTISTQVWNEFMAQVPADVIVALDEAYFEYNRAEDTPVATQEITRYPNVVGLRTFSKAYGLAGARVGYAFGPEPIIAALNKVAVPFSVSTAAQAGALASLPLESELAARVDATCAQRDRLEEFFAASGTPHSETNFVWVPAGALNTTPQEFAAALADAGVLVRAFDEGIRITVTNEAEADACMAAWEKTQ